MSTIDFFRGGRSPAMLGAVALVAAMTAVGVGEAARQVGDPALPAVPEVAGLGGVAAAGAGALDAGSSEPGTQTYPIDEGAVFVATDGDDDAAGTLEAPLRTIKQAIRETEPGGMVVLRAGEYHEEVTIPDGRSLTLQNYPGEAVWLDGSVVVDGWRSSGSAWTAPWTTVFDSSPTYTRGADDLEEENWAFINPEHPMAAHPDQVWVDGVAQRQVGALAEVEAGTFFFDESAGVLHLGTDPTGLEVRVSAIQRAMSIRAEDTTIRGIGIRRFAPSVPDMGAVTIERPRVTLEHVVVSDTATTGIFVTAAGATLTNVTSTRNGMIGVAANYADDFRADGLKSSGNNVEEFNRAPVSGGLKFTRSRGIVIAGSEFSDNLGTALWFDQSSKNMVVADSAFQNNRGHGVFFEISSHAALLDSLVTNNSEYGMKINDTSDVDVRGNLVVGNGRAGIAVLQDQRIKSDASVPGHDERHMDDPEMTWLGTDVSIVRNTLVGNGTARLLWVEDYTRTRTGDDFGITIEGNVFARSEAGEPQELLAWPERPKGSTVFLSLDDFRTATGHEASGREFRGTDPVGSTPSAPSRLPAAQGWLDAYVEIPEVHAALTRP